MIDETKYELIKELIVKHMVGEISNLEQQWLQCWINEDKENKDLFEKIISKNNLEFNFKDFIDNDYKRSFNKFLEIKREKERKHRFKLVYKLSASAAVLAIIMITSYQLLYDNADKKSHSEFISEINHPNSPILKLSSGEIISFDNKTTLQNIEDADSEISIDNGRLVYANGSVEEEKISYNELIVPSKCRYPIVLSDSTKVWVNSNSSIRYPVAFGGKNRKVYITGEVLFEVKKDHRPFIVETKKLSIEVLGTTFNINSYDDIEDIKVTLVNGSVMSYNDKFKYTLKPNEQLSYNKETQKFSVDVVNANYYTQWKDGIYYFDEIRLSEIMNVVKKWYGIDYQINNQKNSDIIVTGILDMSLGLENFLYLLSKSTKLEFLITDNVIEIK